MPNLKQRLFAKANEVRKEKGCPPFVYDARLEVAAQEHANDLSLGKARPHDRLRERIEKSGFPIVDDCCISRASQHVSFTEGIVNTPKDRPIDEKKAIDYLIGTDTQELHYVDFVDVLINRLGIGFVEEGKVVVLDYGRICSLDPIPTPVKPLSVDDFDML